MKGESELDGTLGPQSVLSTFIEFFGIALGPQYEMALYELNDDNTGTAVQGGVFPRDGRGKGKTRCQKML